MTGKFLEDGDDSGDEAAFSIAAIKAKYSSIEQQNKALMARLERLEAIALGSKPAGTVASLK